MNPFLWIATVVIGAWVSFRLFMFVRKRVRLNREKHPPGVRCPACNSTKLDDYSDRESGYCLSCRNVWGVAQKK